MLEVDGSFGEGGGQVVRTAVALSALTGRGVRIRKIRAGRPKPGLAAQHCTAVRAVALVCGAALEGCSTGSGSLLFEPGEIRRTAIALDIGTAGSIPLVLQAWLPVALVRGGSITLTGGTEVEKSPTIDYFSQVFLPVLRAHGAGVRVEVRARGYYPAGGGEVHVAVEPSTLAPIDQARFPHEMGIVSCTQNLPDHVGDRQASAASAVLPDFPVTIDRRTGRSTGTSVTAWAGAKGASALGRLGLPAERVGRAAAEGLLSARAAPGAVDEHLADQLLIYLALSGGEYTAPHASSHAMTARSLLSAFGYEIAASGTVPVVFSA